MAPSAAQRRDVSPRCWLVVDDPIVQSGRRDVGQVACGQARFRAWLRDRYGTAQKLRDAWRNPPITFDTVNVPGAPVAAVCAAALN